MQKKIEYDLEGYLNSRDKSLEDIKGQIRNLKNLHDIQLGQLEQSGKTQQVKTEELSRKIEDLHGKLHDIPTKQDIKIADDHLSSSIDSKLAIAKKENAAKFEELQKLNAEDKREKDEEIDEMKKKIKENEKAQDAIEDKINQALEEKAKEIEKLAAKTRDENNEALDSFKDKIESKLNEQEKSQKAARQAQEEKLKEFEETAETNAKKQKAMVEKDIEGTKDLIEDLQKKYEKVNTEKQDMAKEIEELRNSEKKIMSKIEEIIESKQRENEAKREVEEIKKDKNIKNQIAKLQEDFEKEINNIKEENRRKEKEAKEDEEKKAEKVEKLENTVSDLEKKCEELKEMLENTENKGKVEELSKKIENVEDEQAKKFEEIEQNYQQEIDALKKRCNVIEEEAKKAKNEMKSLAETTTGKINSLEKKLNDLNSEQHKINEQLGKRIEDLEKKVESLKVEIQNNFFIIVQEQKTQKEKLELLSNKKEPVVDSFFQQDKKDLSLKESSIISRQPIEKNISICTEEEKQPALNKLIQKEPRKAEYINEPVLPEEEVINERSAKKRRNEDEEIERKEASFQTESPPLVEKKEAGLGTSLFVPHVRNFLGGSPKYLRKDPLRSKDEKKIIETQGAKIEENISARNFKKKEKFEVNMGNIPKLDQGEVQKVTYSDVANYKEIDFDKYEPNVEDDQISNKKMEDIEAAKPMSDASNKEGKSNSGTKEKAGVSSFMSSEPTGKIESVNVVSIPIPSGGQSNINEDESVDKEEEHNEAAKSPNVQEFITAKEEIQITKSEKEDDGFFEAEGEGKVNENIVESSPEKIDTVEEPAKKQTQNSIII